MDKHILAALLNMFWQWSVIVGVIFLVAHWFRRSYLIRHASWLTALVAMPLLLVLNGVVPGISFKNASSNLSLRDFQQVQPAHIDIDQSVGNEQPVTSTAKAQPLIVNRQSSIVNSGWYWTRWVLIA